MNNPQHKTQYRKQARYNNCDTLKRMDKTQMKHKDLNTTNKGN